jgi:hypothetical protein
MKVLLLLIVLLSCSSLFVHSKETCLPANANGESPPKRLVVIQGKAMIINFPGRDEVPATSETLIFKKAGCESCFVGATVDKDGKYQILVADGKYEIIVRNPSSPAADWLAPDQKRFIDTDSDSDPTSVVKFDIRIKMP